jgi:5-methylcytosine-specific restriction enzyme A
VTGYCHTHGRYPLPGSCPDCSRKRNRARGSSTKRGYNKRHRQLASLAILHHPYCAVCNTTEDLTADHIVPLSKGGANTLSNYRVLCRRHNSQRGSGERSHSF